MSKNEREIMALINAGKASELNKGSMNTFVIDDKLIVSVPEEFSSSRPPDMAKRDLTDDRRFVIIGGGASAAAAAYEI